MRKIIVIAGPTAVGKTKYALDIAKKYNGEIVSCDSMQLYKYMDIGSAKPSKSELLEIKHYLIDEIDPRNKFSVAEYQKLAFTAIEEIFNKGKIPIIVGGTGLYLNSLLYEMDFANTNEDRNIRKKYEELANSISKEELFKMLEDKSPIMANRIHPNNVKKIIRALESIELNGIGIEDFKNVQKPVDAYTPILICLNRDRDELYQIINQRVDSLIETGLLNEVKGLLNLGLSDADISMKGIGYKEIISYLNGEYDLTHAIWLIKRNSRRYAKRQITWFKRYKNMKWFNLTSDGLEDIVLWIEKNM